MTHPPTPSPTQPSYFLRDSAYLLLGKLAVISAAACLNIFLAQRLGPQQYGQYGVVMAFLVWVESAANPGIAAALQKQLADYRDSNWSIIQRTALIQSLYSGCLLGISLPLAPLMAWLLRDSALTLPLMLASLDVVFCGVFTVYHSALNGLLRFRRHALGSVSYAAAKLMLIVMLVREGFSLVGALVGNILASVVGMLVTRALLKPLHLGSASLKSHFLRQLAHFAVPVTLFALTMHLLLNLDLFLVKRLLWEQPAAIGCYVLASTLSKCFYSLMLSLPAALFPTLTQAISMGEGKGIALPFRHAERMLWLFVGSAVALVCVFGLRLITWLFSEVYASASQPLWVLVLGMGAMSGLALLSAALQATGDLKTPMVVLFGCVGVALVLSPPLIRRWGMLGAAWTVVLVGFAGMLPMRVHISRRLRAAT